MDKTVLHIGPIFDRGGMAAVIDSITSMEIEGWNSLAVNSYSRTPLWSRLSLVPGVMKKISNLYNNQKLDVLHVHVTHGMSWFRKRFLFWWGIKLNLPLIIHIHSGRPHSIINKSLKLLDKFPLNNRLRIVVLEKRWLDLFPPAYHDRVSVIHNAPRQQFSSYSKTTDNLVFGLFSLPKKHKRHDLALEVLSRIRKNGKEVRLIVSGRPYKDPPEWVEQHGWVSTKKLHAMMRECRYLIHTSQSEGSSMSVIEAISMGLVPIVSEASEETVGKSGVIVRGEDPGEWARVIEDEINNLNREFGYIEDGRNIFNRTKIANQWKKIYDHAVDC